jgi:hypothetical protein
MPERVIAWGDGNELLLTEIEAGPIAAAIGSSPRYLTRLGGDIFYDSNAEWYEHMQRRMMHLAAAALRAHRPRLVLTGLERGWDLALAEAATSMTFTVHGLLPHRGFQSNWKLHQKQRASRIATHFEQQRYLGPRGEPAPWKIARAREEREAQATLLLTLTSPKDRRGRSHLRHLGDRAVSYWEAWVEHSGLM